MKRIVFILSLIMLVTASCKKQKPVANVVENELITTVKLHFIDSITHDTTRFAWQQPGGPGTTITADTIRLLASKIYDGYVEVLDESKNPPFNVTAEIKELQNEHRFYYSATTGRININVTDSDSQVPPMPLGLNFRVATSANGAEQGSFNALLRHYTASSPKTGGATAGSTDIDVTFPLLVK